MRFSLTLTELAAAIGAPPPVIHATKVATTLSTDTRTLQPGDVFLALKGESFDGHRFIEQAVQKGAIAVIAERDEPVLVPVLLVKDTTKALGDIALAARKRFTGPVVGITGSIGKTTTKELVSLVLEAMYSVTKSQANFNNEIGLPQTILGAPDSSTAWVLEMGMRGAGQIAELARIGQPTIGVITGIGFSHIELLGSRQAIANAKGELFEGLPTDGAISIWPTTDDYAETLYAKSRGKGITVAIDAEADVRATDLVRHENGWRFTIHSPWGTQKAFLPSPGRFNVLNALFAVAVGGALGIPLDSMAKALLRYEAPALRLETLKASCGATVIADCYNAAPDSMLGALQTLAESPVGAGGKRVAVLGEMRELGKYAEDAHKLVGKLVPQFKVDLLVLVGEQTTHVSAAAIAAGFDRTNVIYFDKTPQAAEAMAFFAQAGDTILVKGSRALELEKVVKALQPEWSAEAHG